MTPKTQLPLADMVQEWSFQKKYLGKPLKRDCERIQTAYRIKLRSAERFILDDEATKLTCHLSHEEERLPGWAFLARLPYDTIWIEFNLHTKLREFVRMHALSAVFKEDEVAQRLGLLLYRDEPNSDSPKWLCHEFYDYTNIPYIDDSALSPGMATYIFDPEGDPMWPVRGSKIWHSPTLSLLPNFPRAPIKLADANGTLIQTHCDPELVSCGMFKFSKENGSQPIPVTKTGDHWESIGGQDIITGPDWFINRSAVIIDPWWQAHFAGKDPQHTNQAILHSVIECKGMMRWIVTLLAAINGLPRDIKPTTTRPGRRMAAFHSLPYLGHNNLTITLPRDDRVVWAARHLDRISHNARRRWHKVIGHWRVVERGKMIYLCRHLPTMVENGLGICERCQLLIRWIAAHTRGDPTIGMVDHTYNVEAKRQ